MSDVQRAAGTYLVPAARPFTAVHHAADGVRPDCGEATRPEELWVRSPYDPDRDGRHLLCAGCGGTSPAPEPEPAPDPEPTLL